MEKRKFLKLTKKYNDNKCILIPVDSILAIEEMRDNDVKVTFTLYNDITHVFANESIRDIYLSL